MKHLFKSFVIIALQALFLSTVSARNWEVEYNVDALPTNKIVWEISGHGIPLSPSKKVERGLLYLESLGNLNQMQNFHRQWNAKNHIGTIVEARLRLDEYLGGEGGASCMIAVGDGINEEVVKITDVGVYLHRNQSKYLWGTNEKANEFHIYRIETKDNDIKLYIDGVLRIDATGGFSPWILRNWIAFGDGTQGAGSRSTWDYVRYTTNP